MEHQLFCWIKEGTEIRLYNSTGIPEAEQSMCGCHGEVISSGYWIYTHETSVDRIEKKLAAYAR